MVRSIRNRGDVGFSSFQRINAGSIIEDKNKITHKTDDFFFDNFGWIMSVAFLAVMVLIGYAMWHSSCVSADIYDRQNGAHWSCSDFFWTGDQINTQSQTIKLKQ